MTPPPIARDLDDRLLRPTRRYFLGRAAGLSLGAMSLGTLLNGNRTAGAAVPGLPHFAPRAKRVIFLTQSGGPSQIELFDEKPGLMKWAGIELPESVRQGPRPT